MKILYVEDQLSSNLSAILSLFDAVFTKHQKRKLLQLENDEYPASNEEIQQILNQGGVLEVEIAFPNALARIEKEWNKYDLYIIDRQLAKDTDGYSLEEIQEIIPDFSEEDRSVYLSREGDYLLMRLLEKKDAPLASMFYFLTGYKDKIRTQEKLQSYIDVGWFKTDQVFEKGVPEDRQKLNRIIMDAPGILTRRKHREYFRVLDIFPIDKSNQDQLVLLLQSCDTCKASNRSSVMGEARKLLEALVNLIYENNCRQPPLRKGLFDKITDLFNSGLISEEAKCMSLTANNLCSKYGAHDSKVIPSEDVLRTSLYAIRGFINELRDR